MSVTHIHRPPLQPLVVRACQAHSGFTLIELMVTIAILAILMAIAAPSFTPIVDKWRVRQAVESMQSTIYFARSEAIKRGGRVAIRKNPKTTPGCTLANTAEDWGCGWFVFDDSDENGEWKVTEEKLQVVMVPTGTTAIHKGGGESIKLDRYGKMSGLNAKGFIFAPADAGISSTATRGICVASGGRIKVIEDVPCSNN